MTEKGVSTMSAFLNYEGIKGETSDQNHKDWIDILKCVVNAVKKTLAKIKTIVKVNPLELPAHQHSL